VASRGLNAFRVSRRVDLCRRPLGRGHRGANCTGSDACGRFHRIWNAEPLRDPARLEGSVIRVNTGLVGVNEA